MIKIHRIELPTAFGMETVNTFLIKGDRPTLIDCGENTPESYDALKTGLAAHQLTLDDIDRVIITHSHVDHLGLASRLATEHGIDIYVSDLVYPWAVDVAMSWQSYTDSVRVKVSEYVDADVMQGVETMFLGMLSKVLDTWKSVPREHVHTFDHGGGQHTIGGMEWDIIHAPGHSDWQSIFYQPETRQMFGADMLLRIAPTPMYEGSEYPALLKLIESYHKFAAFDISTVYPGHYETFSDHQVKIQQQLSRINKRIEECYDLVKSGHSTMLDIFNVMYKGRMNLPAFNMCWAYIDLLCHEGRIKKVITNSDKAARFLAP